MCERKYKQKLRNADIQTTGTESKREKRRKKKGPCPHDSYREYTTMNAVICSWKPPKCRRTSVRFKCPLTWSYPPHVHNNSELSLQEQLCLSVLGFIGDVFRETGGSGTSTPYLGQNPGHTGLSCPSD